LLLALAISVGASFRAPSKEQVAMGRELFLHEWSPGDPQAGEGDGLGPVFNAKSCVACHFQGGTGGSGPNENNVLAFEVHPTPSRPHGVVNNAVHTAAVVPNLLETSAQVNALFPIVKEGEEVIGTCTIIRRDFDPVQFFTINTPALFGMGLIDRISASAIDRKRRSRSIRGIYHELKGDFDSTGVGRKRIVSSGRIGKFGSKGQFATLEEFVAAACAVEVGLTNPLQAQDQPGKHAPQPDAMLDLDSGQFRALVAFVATLPRPRQILPADTVERNVVHRGETLFGSVGCADCHTPELGGVDGIYSDFLLHDINDHNNAGAYGRVTRDIPLPAGYPKPEEWKTPPLWGVADSAPYFWDGGSPTLIAAVLRHAGAAKSVIGRYQALDDEEQQAIISFLMTLRAPQAVSTGKSGKEVVRSKRPGVRQSL
jgi:CxxC motif-containing protein (DUF1111 family)